MLGVRNALNQNKNIIKNDKKKLTVYVTDSTGKKYFVKLPYTIKYYSELKDEKLLINLK